VILFSKYRNQSKTSKNQLWMDSQTSRYNRDPGARTGIDRSMKTHFFRRKMPRIYIFSCQKYEIIHLPQNCEVSFDNSYKTTIVIHFNV
jgi:hypothetical protein